MWEREAGESVSKTYDVPKIQLVIASFEEGNEQEARNVGSFQKL